MYAERLPMTRVTTRVSSARNTASTSRISPRAQRAKAQRRHDGGVSSRIGTVHRSGMRSARTRSSRTGRRPDDALWSPLPRAIRHPHRTDGRGRGRSWMAVSSTSRRSERAFAGSFAHLRPHRSSRTSASAICGAEETRLGAGQRRLTGYSATRDGPKSTSAPDDRGQYAGEEAPDDHRGWVLGVRSKSSRHHDGRAPVRRLSVTQDVRCAMAVRGREDEKRTGRPAAAHGSGGRDC